MTPSPDTTEGAQLAAWSALKDQWDDYGHSTMTVAGIAAEAALAHDRKALAEQGYQIVKRPTKVELERAFEIAYGMSPNNHEAAVLLVAKRCIFGESLEMKI
jgi:hypothetical protein